MNDYHWFHRTVYKTHYHGITSYSTAKEVCWLVFEGTFQLVSWRSVVANWYNLIHMLLFLFCFVFVQSAHCPQTVRFRGGPSCLLLFSKNFIFSFFRCFWLPCAWCSLPKLFRAATWKAPSHRLRDALTFPARWLESLMEVLKLVRIKITYCMLGLNVAEYYKQIPS